MCQHSSQVTILCTSQVREPDAEWSYELSHTLSTIPYHILAIRMGHLTSVELLRVWPAYLFLPHQVRNTNERKKE